MIKFQKITEDNFEEVIALDAGDNDRFIERNVYSIAEAKVIPEYIVEAIYNDETLVGFVMFKVEVDKSRMYINRFMIDVKFQGRGLGSDAMKLLIDLAKSKELNSISLHVHPENTKAVNFYKGFGFIDTTRISSGEKEYVLELLKQG